MFPFDHARVDPPGVIIDLLITDNNKKKTLPRFPALVDTGSDCIFMPQSLIGEVENLGLDYTWRNVEGESGETDPRRGIFITNGTVDYLESTNTGAVEPILSHKYENLLIMFTAGEFGLLGRPVLNIHLCELDGPNYKCSITKHRES